MAFDPEQLAEATAAQKAAAQDPSPHVRVIAGPGTGKSQTIEQRVCWLLDQGADAGRIVAVSFTRAAAEDLGARIRHACLFGGHPSGVATGTLHSLALRALRAANRLSYPADPVVLHRWEQVNIFDAEFGKVAGHRKVRREQIRRDHEAFWQTGEHLPPQVVPPDPPITENERTSFRAFHRPRTQLYSCVLPGEIVRLCVREMAAGLLDPAALLGIDHLIVDEFQDLNAMDLAFVHGMADRGVQLFAAGDDDQSLYSFRFATPAGIQEFTSRRTDVGDHSLTHCFRCTPRVLGAAQQLIVNNADDGRLEKSPTSMYGQATPPVRGGLGCWSFANDRAEAEGVAGSCARLSAAGMNPRDIMVLLAAPRRQSTVLHAALDAAAVPYAAIREADVAETDAGRAAYAMLAIVCEPHHYIAHRTLMGVRKGVGIETCNKIAQAVITNHRNFRDLFYAPVPDGLLTTTRQRTAVQTTADLCAEIVEWGPHEQLDARLDDLCAHVDAIRGETSASDDLRAFLSELPPDMHLGEVLLYLAADRDDDRRKVLDAYVTRTGQEVDTDELVPDRLRIMTMHGAKGLSARIVFIPGLEEDHLPGAKRAPYPGQVLEAARMLYVSITRARLACILSLARNRMTFGTMEETTRSRFAVDLGKPFVDRPGGIDQALAAQAVKAAERLES